MKEYDDNWELKLGEIEFIVDNKVYVMAAGYIDLFPNQFYVRLWLNNKCLFGCFDCEVKNPHGMNQEFVCKVPWEVREVCIEQAERLYKLRVFA